MSMERLNYLDRAFKTMGLSLGRPEADEMCRLEGRLNLRERCGEFPETAEALRMLARLDRRPLYGWDVQVLLAMAEIAVTKQLRLPPLPLARLSERFLHVPRLGTTAVRIVLANPALKHVLVPEGSYLDEAAGYVFCAVNYARPESVCLLGWAWREDVLCSPKVRLADGEPEVCAVKITPTEGTGGGAKGW